MRVVFVAAIADLTHSGHIRLFERMKDAAGPDGRVVVILHDDQSAYDIKGKIPIQSLEQRKRNLRITGLVDQVLVTKKTDPAKEFENLILEQTKRGNEVIYMRGDDLTKDFPGRWMLDLHKVPIKFVEYTKGVSSTHLREELSKSSM